MKNFLSSLTWSVDDPNRISATVNGICLAVAALIVGFVQYKTFAAIGLDITGSNYMAAIGEIIALAGVIRKGWVAILIWIKPEDAVITPTPVTTEAVTMPTRLTPEPTV